MFAVIFEVQPKPDRWDDYLTLAKHLKPELEAIDGFIDNERFKSTRNGRRLLSLSIWRDEKAVVRWRTHGGHHAVQEKGRFEVFEDYRLRVGEIARDSDTPILPAAQRLDETEIGEAKAATITEISPQAHDGPGLADDALRRQLGLAGPADGLIALDIFESIYNPGKMALLASWRDAKAAGAWAPQAVPGARHVRHRQVRIIRDYAMLDRREAPQHFAAVARPPAA